MNNFANSCACSTATTYFDGEKCKFLKFVGLADKCDVNVGCGDVEKKNIKCVRTTTSATCELHSVAKIDIPGETCPESTYYSNNPKICKEGCCLGCKMKGMQCSDKKTNTISGIPCCSGKKCTNGFCP